MIRYQQDLAAKPGQGARPLPIALRYSLASTAPSEPASVSYTLDSDNDTWFQVAGQPPAKTFQVVHQVDNKTFKSYSDHVTLVRGAGDPSLTDVVIQQSISGASGPPLPDSCIVTVS